MTAPKFGKVELLLRKTKESLSSERVEFNDCGLMITGNYIIIILDERNDVNNTLTSTGNIFNLENVISYKTHAQ
jgi:hypothetical protein